MQTTPLANAARPSVCLSLDLYKNQPTYFRIYVCMYVCVYVLGETGAYTYTHTHVESVGETKWMAPHRENTGSTVHTRTQRPTHTHTHTRAPRHDRQCLILNEACLESIVGGRAGEWVGKGSMHHGVITSSSSSSRSVIHHITT